MTPRNIQLKIYDIKNVRQLTRFLGLIGIESCIRDYSIDIEYGLGLAESKAYVEKKYTYHAPSQSEIIKIKHSNDIAALKSVRMLMILLHKLGLQETNSGLYFAKMFTVNRRGPIY